MGCYVQLVSRASHQWVDIRTLNQKIPAKSRDFFLYNYKKFLFFRHIRQSVLLTSECAYCLFLNKTMFDLSKLSKPLDSI